MDDFGTSHNHEVSREEFVDGISRWLQRIKCSRGASGDAGPRTFKILHMVSCAMLSFLKINPFGACVVAD